MRPKYTEQIENRIAKMDPGCVFTAGDFADIADAKTVHMCLKRLSKEEKTAKVLRGVYCKPRYSALLQEYVPARREDVAKAIARNYGWNIVPADDTALNMLGLSTQVPAVWDFISDGPYKIYDCDGSEIRFRHTNRNTELTQVSYKTALVIQALKALGKNRCDPKNIRILAGKLTGEEKETLLKEAQYSTGWIYEIIKRICTEASYA